MITTTSNLSSSDANKYRELYKEAGHVLMGYKPVKTFQPDIINTNNYVNSEDAGYFKYNEILSDEVTEHYEQVTVEDRASFVKALQENTNLYIKICNEATEGKLIARGQIEDYDADKGITTLAEYFHWLKELSSVTTIDNEEYGRRFTRLPLDEPYFEINADDRSISIPAGFKKNGIAVQGDDLAEIVYFKINRYFDYMDFNNCEIAIQWETPNGKDTNGNTVKAKASISEAYVRDIESEPGYLIFGWAISEALTHTSGNLKFSVRFYQMDEDNKIAYNFNTLTANATVKTGLHIDLSSLSEEDIDDAGDRLLERIESSQLAEGGYVAAQPYWIIDLVEDEASESICDLDENGKYELEALAMAADTGMITYIWKRKNNDDSITTLEGSFNYVAADINNLDSSINYFIKTNNGNYTSYVGSIPATEDDIANYSNNIYERHAVYTADQIGTYYVVAENRVTNSSKDIVSKKVKFPAPVDPEFKENLIEHLILSDENSETISVTMIEEEMNVPVYHWTSSDSIEGEWIDADNAEDTNSYTVSTPGYYKVNVSNTRNKAETDPVSSAICRATYAPQVPELEEMDSNLARINVAALSKDNCPKVVIKDTSIESDRYIVDWYVYDDNKNKGGKIISDYLEDGTMTSSFNPNDYADVIHNLTDDNNVIAQYYPQVYNELNGAITEEYATLDTVFTIYATQTVTLNLDEEEEEY